MDTLNKGSSRPNLQETGAHLKETASELLQEGKKMANELYEEGIHKAQEAQDMAKDTLNACSHDLSKKVQENPLTALLIAGGIGFLLSALLRK